MKIFLVHLIAIFELICSTLVAAEFFNVSSMKGVEDRYFRMKRRRPSVRPPQEEKITAKLEVCSAILTSEFFDMHNMALVDPNQKMIHDQVREHHPLIHTKHYSSKLSDVNKPKFANPYGIYDVSVHGDVIREYMFTCLVQNCSTKHFEEYFISPEYNTDGSAKMVRFVFTLNEKKEVVVIAVAEKCSVSPYSNKEAVVSKECPTVESTEERSTKDKDSSDYSSSW